MRKKLSLGFAMRVIVLALALGMLSPNPALSQEPGPIYFVDELEEMTHGPPLKEFEVQVGITGEVGEEVAVTLEIADVISEDDESITVSELIDGDSLQVQAITLTGAASTASFTITLNAGLNGAEEKTYTALLVARRSTGESSVKRLTLISGPEETTESVVILSPQVVINATRCPWRGTLTRLCGTAFTAQDPEESAEGLLRPHISGGNRIILQGRANDYIGAEGVAVAEDGRGQVFLQLTGVDEEEECWCRHNTSRTCDEPGEGCGCEDGTSLMCAHRIVVRDRGGVPPASGEFKGIFYLDAADPEESPSVEVIVRLREHITGAYFYLGCGILVTVVLTLIYEKKSKTEGSAVPEDKMKAVLKLLGKGVQFLVLVLAGIYAVYHLNPTFGTHTDHIYAFLWAPTASAVSTVIGKILGKTGFAGLTELVKL